MYVYHKLYAMYVFNNVCPAFVSTKLLNRTAQPSAPLVNTKDNLPVFETRSQVNQSNYNSIVKEKLSIQY